MQWIEKFLLKLRFEGALVPSASLAQPKVRAKYTFPCCIALGPDQASFSSLKQASGISCHHRKGKACYPSKVRQGPPVQAGLGKACLSKRG